MRVGPVACCAARDRYVTVVRNTPLLIIFVFVIVGLPKLGFPFRSVEAARDRRSFFFRACIALTLYTSAFVCEAVRSGINAVPLGQAEAARAIGLTFGGTMTQVVLPQAFRAAVPPLASVLIALLKNTSRGRAFGMLEADRPDEVLHQQQRRRPCRSSWSSPPATSCSSRSSRSAPTASNALGVAR